MIGIMETVIRLVMGKTTKELKMIRVLDKNLIHDTDFYRSREETIFEFAIRPEDLKFKKGDKFQIWDLMDVAKLEYVVVNILPQPMKIGQTEREVRVRAIELGWVKRNKL